MISTVMARLPARWLATWQGVRPAQKRQHNDAEFDDEIGRGHFKRHGGGEVGSVYLIRVDDVMESPKLAE